MAVEFTQEQKVKIRQHAKLPHAGALRGKLWALIGGPKLGADEIAFMARSTPSWALDDAILVSSIARALEYDELLMKVKSGEIRLED